MNYCQEVRIEARFLHSLALYSYTTNLGISSERWAVKHPDLALTNIQPSDVLLPTLVVLHACAISGILIQPPATTN